MLPKCTVLEKKNPSLRPSWVMDKRTIGTWILPGPSEKDHRAAEDVPRSGPTEMRDQVAVQGMEFLGSVAKMGEIQLHGKPSKGIAPQPMRTQGDQKEKEARILLSTWKLNAFTCFAASSWGERIVEVDACCVQLVFGKHGFDF